MHFPSLAALGAGLRPVGITVLPLLTGCAITLNLPVSRFESPEAHGRNHIFLEGGLQGANKAVIIPNTTASPPDVNSPTFDRVGSAPVVGIGLGILDRLDLSVRAQVNTPSLLKAKLQLLGNPGARAERGDFSLAISGGVGIGSKNERDADVLTPVTAVVEADFFAYDAAVIAGYRLSRSLLLYGSVFRTTISVDGKVTQTSPSTRTVFSGSAAQDGGNLGLELRQQHFGAMLEVGYGSASYKSASDEGVFIGAVVRLYGAWND